MSKNWTPFAKMKKAAYNSRRLHLEAIRIGMPIPSPSLSRGRRSIPDSKALSKARPPELSNEGPEMSLRQIAISSP